MMSDEAKIIGGIAACLSVIIGGIGGLDYASRAQINACIEKQAHRPPIEARLVCVGQK